MAPRALKKQYAKRIPILVICKEKNVLPEYQTESSTKYNSCFVVSKRSLGEDRILG